jgi:RHS repeat-associated protein
MNAHACARKPPTRRLAATAAILVLALLAQGLHVVLPATWLAKATADSAAPPTPPKPMELPGKPVVPAAPMTGYLPGSWAVKSNGAFTYTIPLDVPPGRAEMQPDLALSYSSGDGTDGPLGPGWSLSGLSSIARCGKTMSTEGTVSGVGYGAADQMCLDGQKLIQMTGGGIDAGSDVEYRTETASFAKIVAPVSLSSGPDQVTVSTKAGRIRRYEAFTGVRTRSGLAFSPAPVEGDKKVTTPTLMWLLVSEKDRSGNEIRYEYKATSTEQGNEYLPFRIRHTSHNNDLLGHRYVEFGYENRPDASFSYHAGVRFNRSQRLKSISMHAPNPGATQLVWKYDLTYSASPLGRSLLASVAKCAPSGACLRAKQFSWASANRPVVAPFASTSLGQLDLHMYAAHHPYLHVADLNDDGTDDIVYTPGGTSLYGPDTMPKHDYVRLGSRGLPSTPAPLANGPYQLDGAGDYPANVLQSYSGAVDLDGDGASEFVAYASAAGGLRYERLRWDDANHRMVLAQTGQLSPKGFADVNGDGRPDHVSTDSKVQGSVQLNNGGSLGNAVITSYPAGCASRFTDLEGDGRADVLIERRTGEKSCSFESDALRADDNGVLNVTSTSSVVGGVTYFHALMAATGYKLTYGDFNGDGLQDTLLAAAKIDPATGNWDRPGALAWNTGAGLALDPHPVHLPVGNTELRVADINADGRDDLVALHDAGITAMVSRGDGSFASSTISSNAGTVDPSYGRVMTQLGDFNGDGRLDVVRAANDMLAVLIQEPSDGDRLVSVRDENTDWARTTVRYSTAWTDHLEDTGDFACAYPLACIRRGFPVTRQVSSRDHMVSTYDSNDPMSAPYEQFYSFEDPVRDVRGRGFLGFATMRVWDPQRPVEIVSTYRHRDRVDGKYYPYVDRPDTVTTVVPILGPVGWGDKPVRPKSATARVTRSHSSYDVRHPEGQGRAYAVFPKSSHTTEWEQPVSITWADSLLGTSAAVHVGGVAEPATPARRIDSSGTFDDYGNRTSYYTATDGGARQWLNTTFDNRVSSWLISLPVVEKVTRSEADADPAPVTRTTEHHYNDAGLLDTAWMEKDNPNPGIPETISYYYNTYGVIREVSTAAAGVPTRRTHVEYEPVFANQPDEKVFPSQIWSDHQYVNLRPSLWLAVHPGYGVPVASMDANGVQSSALYDDLGHLTQSNRPGADSTKLSYAPNSSGGDTSGTNITAITGPQRSKTILDAMGRALGVQSTGFNGSASTAAISYDLLGRVVSQTTPAPGGTTRYTYDSLDRRLKTTLPDSTTRTSTYTMFSVKSVDALNRERIISYDVDGRVSTSTAIDTSGATSVPVTTRYEYGPFDVLDKVTDTKGNVTDYQYDVRGRRTLLDEPDRGKTTTTYFGTGEVDTETHAASGHSTAFEYDDLGRRIASVSEDGTSSFVWDVAANGIGQLAWATSPDKISTTYRYDALGRPAGTDHTDQLAGATYQTDLHYDATGSPASLEYPTVPGRARFTLQYGYNAAGFLNTIGDATPGQPYQNLWTVQSRNPDMSLDTAKLGNGAGTVALKNSYDPVTGRLENLLATTQSNTKIQDITYGYYPSGLLRTREDGVHNRSETFGYDSLNRLTDWDLSAANQQSNTDYVYDSIDNLIQVTHNGVVTEKRGYGKPDGSQPHTLTSRTPIQGPTQIYGYDAQGRQDSGGGRDNVTYTAFDLPKTITKAGKTTTYAYDAFGRRVKETSPTGSTFTIPGLYEARTAGNATTHVFHISGTDGPIGQAVHTGTTTTMQYQLNDGPGSVATTVDSTGKATQDLFYEPFGGRINSDGTPFTGNTGDLKEGFTGHQHDDSVGLINMNGRVYDPNTRNFLTADPIVTNPLVGADWNPYSYVRNNPTNYTDPTGYTPCDGAWPGNDETCVDVTGSPFTRDPGPGSPSVFGQDTWYNSGEGGGQGGSPGTGGGFDSAGSGDNILRNHSTRDFRPGSNWGNYLADNSSGPKPWWVQAPRISDQTKCRLATTSKVMAVVMTAALAMVLTRGAAPVGGLVPAGIMVPPPSGMSPEDIAAFTRSTIALESKKLQVQAQCGQTTYLYRGLNPWHRQLDAAKQGIVRAANPKGLVTPAQHNDGASEYLRDSPYTSWTFDRNRAIAWAAQTGGTSGAGVVLRVPADSIGAGAKTWEWVTSPDLIGESEILLKGERHGVEVFDPGMLP